MSNKLAGVIIVIFSCALRGTSALAGSYECDEAESARDTLESAAIDLLACTKRRDYSDDCSAQIAEIASVGADYEDAVANAEDECY
jgi:hypothetical protein